MICGNLRLTGKHYYRLELYRLVFLCYFVPNFLPMKRILILIAIAFLGINLNAQTMNKKTLVAYFSATGTTEKVAQKLVEVTHSDLFEINPETPYTAADLDWRDKNSRSTIEMNDKASRPAIAGKLDNMADYDVVYLGFPIWWYVAPTIINTFLESYDFSGKTIVLFATSGSSGFGNTVAELQPSAPGEEIIETKVLSGIITEAKISALIDACQ